jgi:CheY-like chemotaxis protein
MKRKVMLVVNAETETVAVTTAVASELQLDVQFISGPEALSRLEQELTDIATIVLDTDRGLSAGFVVPEQIRDTVNIPVVVISSYDKSWLEPLVGTDSNRHYLAKPVSSDQLEPLVRQLLSPGEEPSCRCDRSGHRCPDCAQHELAVEPREITTLVNH